MASRGLDGVLDSARQVGRHFAIVAAIPSLVVVGFLTTLIAAGAPTSRPEPGRALSSFSDAGLADAGFLIVVVLATGFVLQPFVFPVTQFLEGYWGTSSPARRAMGRSTSRHLARALCLERSSLAASDFLADADEKYDEHELLPSLLDENDVWTPEAEAAWEKQREALLFQTLEHRIERQESERLRARYPRDFREVMPTRLGNVLRSHERHAGSAYGLDAIVVTGQLTQVVDPRLREFHDDARTGLDLSVQTIVMWVAISAIGFVLLWRYDAWLAIPAFTSTLAIVSYRGAVHSAEAYGEALEILIALGRFRLYESVGMPFPRSGAEEFDRNVRLMAQLRGQPTDIPYELWGTSPTKSVSE